MHAHRSTLTTIVWLLGLLLPIGVPGIDVQAEVQAVRIEYVDFEPTLVGELDWNRLFITGLKSPATYRIDRSVRSPFNYTGNASDLVVRFGRIWVDVSFFPLTEGRFTDEMRLVREPLSGSNDTIVIRFNGDGYRIDRRELIDFGRVNTGDTAKRPLWVRRELANNEQWRMIGRDIQEFDLVTKNGPVGNGDTVAFQFSFTPLRQGFYSDTVGLVRSFGGFDIDTIIVYLQGTGVDFNLRSQLDFQTVVTGDSVAKARTFLSPTSGNSRYRLEHRPARPFVLLLIGNEPLPKPPDSGEVRVGFVPLDTGSYRDSVIITRLNLNDEILDTIKIQLSGNGGGLPAVAEGAMYNVEVGQSSTTTVDVVLAAKPVNALFRYELIRRDPGPINGSIDSPIGVSRNQVITSGFTTEPTSFAYAVQTFVLRRFSDANKRFDSTIITVRQYMKPRPLQFRLDWSSDTLHQRIGDTVDVNLVLVTDDPIDVPISISSITGSVIYNPTLIVPLLDAGTERVVIDDRPRMAFRFLGPIPVASQVTVVGNLRFVVVMGDTDRSDLDMQRVQMVQGQGDPEDIQSSDAALIVTNVWRYQDGRPRYVNPISGPLTLDIDPNPVTSQSTLRVRNVTSGSGILEIIDASGRIVADLTTELRSGTRDWIISKGAGGSVNIGPGTYYARLLVQGTTASSINSMVRLFIVQ